MNIGRTLYVHTRKDWRAWLSAHHASSKEIWLIYYKIGSGKPRIPYDVSVEEALCYGWIDSIVKPIDADRYAQRFSPRRAGSALSETNKERIRRLVKAKKMTRAGWKSIEHHLHPRRGATLRAPRLKTASLPKDIVAAVRANPAAWKHYQSYSATYRRIRVGWIDASRNRPEAFRKRLRYFIAMTAKNKQFGQVR